MTTSNQLPEDVRAVLRDTIEHLPNAFSETIIDAIAPVIEAWVRKDQAEKDAQIADSEAASGAISGPGAWCTARAIRGQFTTKATVAADAQ
jgi:DNA recombination-dependent growth factor C